MRIINRDDKPPALHGSGPGRKVAVLSGKLSRVTNGKQQAGSRTGRRGFDSRPGASSPRDRRPSSKSWW